MDAQGSRQGTEHTSHAGHYGPYHAAFIAAGSSLAKRLGAAPAGQGVRLSGWVKPDAAGWLPAALLRLQAADGTGIDLRLQPDGIAVDGRLHHLTVEAGRWTWFDLALEAGAGAWAELVLGPRDAGAPFAGKIAMLRLRPAQSGADQPCMEQGGMPRDALLAFESNASTWPIQCRQQAGLEAPQDGDTLPVAAAGPARLAAPVPAFTGPVLQASGTGRFALGAWRLCAAPQVEASGERLSEAAFDAGGWLDAVVPGTVLSTLIARGQVPDPSIGLANLEVPEALCRQDYWYRTQFDVPAEFDGRHAYLRFDGINYAAEVYCNGVRLGAMTGAFIRGRFDLSGVLHVGRANAVAVRVSPPPHPGIPHEQSLAGGPGANGGILAMDGPTFVCTEGWDWIPGVRDRNTGIWQAVELGHTGPVRVGDAQVVAHFDDGSLARARLALALPLTLVGAEALPVTVELELVDLSQRQPVRRARLVRRLQAGTETLHFDGASCEALDVADPLLWWPNGYGRPDLYRLDVTVHGPAGCSDRRSFRFGIRKLSVEMSMVDGAGAPVRVEVDPVAARAQGVQVADLRHQGIRQVRGGLWVPTLTQQGATSDAVRRLPDDTLAPFLVLKVNGVRIAARGGNWGMDDWLKRVDRERLEPYFRLHRDAHINVIRNWVGQCTEQVFFELADEYGMLVLNDFWASTQDHQVEPGDPALFLANAQDVIRRFRNHPSICAWIGRNEGVPQPAINEGLDRLVRDEDGTRVYLPNSREINLQESGPWNFREPQAYYDGVARGFSTEVGTQSFPTLESFESFVPEADRWPVSDTWAYHDWHTDENGDTAPFEAALAERFGAPQSLADFERKAQMLNFESHRAIFEGMNAGLWTRHSGRLLWMTHPAWPSTQWQIYSHDYDTHAAFYGTRCALEPAHAQLRLPGHELLVVNVGVAALAARLAWRILKLDGAVLATGALAVALDANTVSAPIDAGVAQWLEREDVVLLQLELFDAAGARLSRNVYWLSAKPGRLRALNGLAPVSLELQVRERRAGSLLVSLRNPSAAPSLHNKLTLQDIAGARILPAFYSDNYISLMPGEAAEIRIEAAGGRPARLALRGWNTLGQTLDLGNHDA